jgi:transposase
MTPRHRESDTKVHRGRITKQGNNLVRWSAVEAV